MGDVKDNMKTTDLTKKDDGGGIFGRLKGRRAKAKDEPAKAQNYADHIESADQKLRELIIKKEADLKTETGQEAKNKRSLAILSTMQFHLDEICNLAEEYQEN